jgi:hypothetical protein
MKTIEVAALYNMGDEVFALDTTMDGLRIVKFTIKEISIRITEDKTTFHYSGGDYLTYPESRVRDSVDGLIKLVGSTKVTDYEEICVGLGLDLFPESEDED